MEFEEDGLATPEIGNWSTRKHALIQNYAGQFATAMKNTWECRVYLDLFAGAGLARIKGTGRLTATSALLAMDIPDPFDQYVLADLDPTNLDALRQRVAAYFPNLQDRVKYCVGDANEVIDGVLTEMPRPNRSFRVLSFCVLDPFSLAPLKFDTIRRISSFYVDFLMLIATDMDGRRNQRVYSQPDNNVIDQFLGDPGWRDAWVEEQRRGTPFALYLVSAFSRRMEHLGFLYSDPNESVLIRNTKRNAPLYRIALYSRHRLGHQFWKDTRKASDPQMTFELE